MVKRVIKKFLQLVCPVCRTTKQLGQHFGKFETIEFPDELVHICRACNWPARIVPNQHSV